MTILKSNSVQFGVVREDASVEIEIFKKFQISRPILIASGGCSAFNLATVFPSLSITLLEPNPAQIEQIKRKSKVLLSGDRNLISGSFGVGTQQRDNLNMNEQGNFEALFRQFRSFIYEFVLESEKLFRLFQSGKGSGWKEVFNHPYWPVAFDLYFSDSILRTMFGDAAVQHSPRGSYSRYFRSVIEKGLCLPSAKDNYFLYHIFFGHYLKGKKSLPAYLISPPKRLQLQFENCMAEDLESYAGFDFVGLSNIFDWSSPSQVKTIARKVARDLPSGGVVLFRQLNNEKDFTRDFGKSFVWKKALAKALHSKDRSLFYQSLHLGVKK